MLRFNVVLVAGLMAAAPVSAANWADGMFTEQGKDFGLVPRGPTLTHYFLVTNKSDKQVHIAGVRVSCGCTTATALQQALAPGQSTAIQALMDTRRFSGHKQVTIFVSFDQPQWDEVQLFVRAYGSDDISVSPAEFVFPGKVKLGTPATSKVTIQFTSGNWQILGNEQDSGYVEASFKEVRRDASSVVYEVTASLRKDTPAGKWFTDVWLKTNQGGLPKIRIPLTVEIESAAAAPRTITFGEIKAGESAERKISVKGAKPFRVMKVEGADGEVTAKTSEVAKDEQEVTITFKPSKAGIFDRKLIVVTDLSDLKQIEVLAHGTVIR
jgi:Protein of unknown function (DUF1573)